MKKRLYLPYLAVIMMMNVAPTSMWAAERAQQSKAKLIAKAQSAFSTLKEDMSCLFSRKKRCTREQKKRIAIAAAAVATTVALLAAAIGIGVVVMKRKKAARIRAEARRAAEDARLAEEQAETARREAEARRVREEEAVRRAAEQAEAERLAQEAARRAAEDARLAEEQAERQRQEKARAAERRREQEKAERRATAAAAVSEESVPGLKDLMEEVRMLDSLLEGSYLKATRQENLAMTARMLRRYFDRYDVLSAQLNELRPSYEEESGKYRARISRSVQRDIDRLYSLFDQLFDKLGVIQDRLKNQAESRAREEKIRAREATERMFPQFFERVPSVPAARGLYEGLRMTIQQNSSLKDFFKLPELGPIQWWHVLNFDSAPRNLRDARENYYNLARRFHPDKEGAEYATSVFQDIEGAYEAAQRYFKAQR